MLLTTIRTKRFSLFFLLATLLSLIGASLYLHAPVFAQSGWTWYKTDLHVHSVISADAFDDLGIQSQAAKSLGYNALFLTDHNLASSFPISSLTANNMVFEDSYTRWTSGTYGSPSSTTNALSAAQVHTGVNSLHLVSSASGYGETYVWTHRGPNFRSGDIIIKVSIYPTRIDPGSGVYISASIGGDVTVQSPDGYTTSSGVVSPGKSIVLVWQLGAARQASSDPNSRVLTYPLTYTLNTWNNYTINVTSALAGIPSADLPLAYNAVTYLKMAAAANGGTANAYFDTYSITPSAPVSPADEFVYRTSVIPTYNTSTFKIFPSLEMGIGRHAQRLNFGITNPSQFVSYTNGIDGILPAQQSGYPAMLNHPGSAGGVSDQEAISTQGEGADLMEVRQQGWIDNWDAILQQGVQLLGAGTTDTHRVFSGSSYATYVYGPALTFDSLVQSIFEGRTYIAVGSFGDQGRVIFNLDNSSQEPYPARYPVYVPSTQSSANVHLSVTGGLQSGYTIKWIRNGTLLATDSTVGASYETTKAISLGGAWTYVRAEIRDSSGAIKALTQPLVFVTVPGMPADKSYYIDGITTADGRQYTKLFVKGITLSGWNATSQVLTLTLKNPANALVDMRLLTGSAPQSIQVDGGLIPVADSLTTFQAASSSRWYYNGLSGLLYLKVLQATDTSNVSIVFANTGTTTPKPTGTPTSTPTSTVTSTPTATNTSVFTPIPGNDLDTTGVFRPSNGALYLKNSNTTGVADIQINYGIPGDQPVTGDWNGDGVDTIGVYRNGVFYLRNTNSIGIADLYFAFGSPGDQPIAGDWDGNGTDTIGVYRSSNFTFYLRNDNSSGPPDLSFSLGMPGDVGIAGDWDKDGKDTTGVFRPSNGVIFLKNTNSTGTADVALNYGIPGDKPVTGDWDNDGRDTIGVYRNGVFYLRNSNTVGTADLYFSLGIPGDLPIAGNWDGLPSR